MVKILLSTDRTLDLPDLETSGVVDLRPAKLSLAEYKEVFSYIIRTRKAADIRELYVSGMMLDQDRLAEILNGALNLRTFSLHNSLINNNLIMAINWHITDNSEFEELTLQNVHWKGKRNTVCRAISWRDVVNKVSSEVFDEPCFKPLRHDLGAKQEYDDLDPNKAYFNDVFITKAQENLGRFLLRSQFVAQRLRTDLLLVIELYGEENIERAVRGDVKILEKFAAAKDSIPFVNLLKCCKADEPVTASAVALKYGESLAAEAIWTRNDAQCDLVCAKLSCRKAVVEAKFLINYRSNFSDDSLSSDRDDLGSIVFLEDGKTRKIFCTQYDDVRSKKTGKAVGGEFKFFDKILSSVSDPSSEAQYNNYIEHAKSAPDLVVELHKLQETELAEKLVAFARDFSAHYFSHPSRRAHKDEFDKKLQEAEKILQNPHLAIVGGEAMPLASPQNQLTF